MSRSFFTLAVFRFVRVRDNLAPRADADRRGGTDAEPLPFRVIVGDIGGVGPLAHLREPVEGRGNGADHGGSGGGPRGDSGRGHPARIPVF